MHDTVTKWAAIVLSGGALLVGAVDRIIGADAGLERRITVNERAISDHDRRLDRFETSITRAIEKLDERLDRIPFLPPRK